MPHPVQSQLELEGRIIRLTGERTAPAGGVLLLNDPDEDPDEFGKLCEGPLLRRRLAGFLPQFRDPFHTSRTLEEWGDTPTEETLLAQLLPEALRSSGLLPGSKPALFGIGVGGHSALRLGFRYPERFAVVGAWIPCCDVQDLYGQGSVLDRLYDSPEKVRLDSAVLQIQPIRFPAHIHIYCPQDHDHHRGCDRLLEKLRATGIPHTAETPATASDPAGAVSRMFDFLQQSLIQESRRLN
jgi:esterase/lipase superfamily enzyme